MNKKPQSLSTLLAEIRACRVCAEHLPHGVRPVLRLTPKAKLLIAGQAPGLRVHNSGVPYSDPSGERLRAWMGVTPDIFYDESLVAIVPMGFCFPGYDETGADLPPRPECVRTWHDRLFAAAQTFDLVLVIGAYAHRYHLKERAKKSVSETVRGWRDYGRIIPLPHPSWRNNGWLKKNPWFEFGTSPPSSPMRGFSNLARALALSFLALTAACAPELQRLGPEMRMPAIEQVQDNGTTEDRYVTRDGTKLGLMHWDAAMPKAIIVGLHGMNDYSNAFSMPAPFWASQGISTYAYDQRGFGKSPQRGIWPGGDLMRRDLADFVDVMRARYPGRPVYVLGESMGGAVAMTAFASGTSPKADGLILIAPAVWGRQSMPLTYRIGLWMGAHTIRSKSFTGSGLKITPSDNIEMLRANFRDPLFIKGTRTDAVYGLVQLMGDAYASAPHLKDKNAPILYLYGGRDELIPKAPTETVMGEVAGPETKIMTYPTGYHMLLRDLNAEPRWADVAKWIEDQSRTGAQMAVAAE